MSLPPIQYDNLADRTASFQKYKIFCKYLTFAKFEGFPQGISLMPSNVGENLSRH